MLQVFRSFSWLTAALLVLVALILRTIGFGVDASVWATVPVALGSWGEILAKSTGDFALSDWVLGAVLTTAVGVLGAGTLNHYRLGAHGMVPALMSVLVGSAAVWWLAYSPYLVSAVLLAAAAHRLFAGYRYQGAALPVYDCGLLLGAAWLIAPPFVWMVLWSVLALAQLRKLKVLDVIQLLIGVCTLPAIAGLYAYWRGTLLAFRQNLGSGIVGQDILTGFGESWQTLALLALLTGACIGAFGRLTTRRPIQEQRATRMWYLMLGVAWIAILASGVNDVAALSLLLYPISVLLGMWLNELSRRIANLILLVGAGCVLAGYVLSYFDLL